MPPASWVPNWYEPTKYFPIHKILYNGKYIPERTLAPYERRALQSLKNNERQVQSSKQLGILPLLLRFGDLIYMSKVSVVILSRT
jgi:hypothetical protein